MSIVFLPEISVPLTRTVDEAIAFETFIPSTSYRHRYVWTAAIPALPAGALGAIIFESVWIRTKNWGRLSEGLERGAEALRQLDGKSCGWQSTWPQYSSGGEIPNESTGPRGWGPGGHPPSVVSGVYFVVDHYDPIEEAVLPPCGLCDQYFRYPIIPTYLPKWEEETGEAPNFTFRDPAWAATFTPRVFTGGVREHSLIPRALMPATAELEYKGEPSGNRPFGVHSEWSVMDERLVILPYREEGPPPPEVPVAMAGPQTIGRVRSIRQDSR